MEKILPAIIFLACALSLNAADSKHDKKNNLLCFEAKRWIGVVEEGNNAGQLIKIFQCACDGKASQEPWCMAFAQYCIKMTEETYAVLFPDEQHNKSTIFRSEHCLTTWNKSPHLRIEKPIKGALCIWQKYEGTKPTKSGHTGIVVEVNDDGNISIVEGNTERTPDSSIEREDDGVYLKYYKLGQMNRGNLVCKGFLKAW